MARRGLPVLLSVLGILVLSACSDSSSGSDPTTSATREVAPTSVAQTSTTIPEGPQELVVTSSAYAEGERIPTMHTCDGADISPDYTLSGLPADTVSIALVMDDPDAPRAVWDHWVVYDMPQTTEIPPDASEIGTMGSNSWDRLGYSGPCPPPGNAHRYVVTVYALDAFLGLEEGVSKSALMTEMEGHVIASGVLKGEYSR